MRPRTHRRRAASPWPLRSRLRGPRGNAALHHTGGDPASGRDRAHWYPAPRWPTGEIGSLISARQA